jgi:hypothetical protein
VVIPPIVGYFRFVADTPRIVGITLLVLPSGIVEVMYQAFEFWKGHPDFFNQWR